MKENKDDQLLSLKLTEKIEFSYYKDTFLNLYNKSKIPIFILLMGFCFTLKYCIWDALCKYFKFIYNL